MTPPTWSERVDAVCLTGGSACGLAAAVGVTRWLADHNCGFPVGPRPRTRSYQSSRQPCSSTSGWAATSGTPPTPRSVSELQARLAREKFAQGTVGAGTGAHAEQLKGGIGSASVVLPVRDHRCRPRGAQLQWQRVRRTGAASCSASAAGSPTSSPTSERRAARTSLAHHADPPAMRPLNTTLAVIATDAALTKTEYRRMAISGQDGLARAIDPVHQYVDGDVVFALATGERPVPDGSMESRLRSARARPGHCSSTRSTAAGADTVCSGHRPERHLRHECWWSDELPRPVPFVDGGEVGNYARRHASGLAPGAHRRLLVPVACAVVVDRRHDDSISDCRTEGDPDATVVVGFVSSRPTSTSSTKRAPPSTRCCSTTSTRRS